MTDFPTALTGGCKGCKESPALDFEFEFAYQPIVDVRDRSDLPMRLWFVASMVRER